MIRVEFLLVGIFLTIGVGETMGEEPRVFDSRLQLTPIAEQPTIVTPTGLDVDSQDRVWVIESNTHFPPENYKGYPTDRIFVFTRAGDKTVATVFADGLKHSMSIAVKPAWLTNFSEDEVLQIFIATRREVLVLEDLDGDLKCDRTTKLIELETAGDYPHNGLAGFAFDPMGWMYFGFGENLGASYLVHGSDGKSVSGGAEGGSVFRCRTDGTEMSRFATGFWNPHASAFDSSGRLFTVDNDPDSKPPCRLMHIVPQGDYGYRFRNGRKGLHPFTSWNGELPGTLPMLAGTGEAPSGLVAYEETGLGEDYKDNLLAGSWGDHRIDRFVLNRQRATLVSVAEPMIQGGEDFRPVGLGVGSDGSLYFSDWVKRDYTLHLHGKVWEFSRKEQGKREPIDQISPARSIPELTELLFSPHMVTRRRAARGLVKKMERNLKELAPLITEKWSDSARIELFWGLMSNPSATANPDAQIALVKQLVQARPKLLEALANALLVSSDPPEELVRHAVAHVFPKGVTDTNSWVWGGVAALIQGGSVPLAELAKLDSELWTDPFLYRALIVRLSKEETIPAELLTSDSMKLAALLARRHRDPNKIAPLKEALKSELPALQRAAVQWASEEKIDSLKPEIEQLLQRSNLTSEVFLSVIAGLEILDGQNPADFDQTPSGLYVLPIVLDRTRPASVRTLALRLVPPEDPALTENLMAELLQSENKDLRTEALRSLMVSPREPLLSIIATDPKAPLSERLDAIVGLSKLAPAEKNAQRIIGTLLESENDQVRHEAIRASRGWGMTDEGLLAKVKDWAGKDLDRLEELQLLSKGQIDPSIKRPGSIEEWMQHDSESDPEQGRRVFFHPKGPGCGKCHTVDGRGGKVGPDLSTIGRTLTRKRLVESILEPNREIAPQFTNWTMELNSGVSHTGMIVFENEGNLDLGLVDGSIVKLKTIDVVVRAPQKASVMPEKLLDLMTTRDFLNLLSFLEERK